MTDQTAPVITLVGRTVTVEAGQAYTDLGASANDTVDGSVLVTVDKSTVDVNVLGSYTVTYSATDNAGNTTSEPRTVIVMDATAPAAPTLAGTTPTIDKTPELSGTAEAGTTDNDIQWGHGAWAGDSGCWRPTRLLYRHWQMAATR